MGSLSCEDKKAFQGTGTEKSAGVEQTVETQDKADIDEAFLSILKDCAGGPMDEKAKYAVRTIIEFY